MTPKDKQAIKRHVGAHLRATQPRELELLLFRLVTGQVISYMNDHPMQMDGNKKRAFVLGLTKRIVGELARGANAPRVAAAFGGAYMLESAAAESGTGPTPHNAA